MTGPPVVRNLPSRAILRQWVFSGDYVGGANAHPAVEIAWCSSGSAEYTIGRKVVTLRPGEALVIPAHVEHRTSVRQPGTLARSIHVPADTMATAAETVGVRLREAALVPGSPHSPSPLTMMGSLLAREADAELHGKVLIVEALTDAVIVEALRSTDAPSRALALDGPLADASDGRLRRAIDLIQDRYSEPLTIEDLARAAGMSRYHFSRLFRAQTGKSPYRYLLDVRMTRAAHLLRAKRCAVTEAAFSVGCSDLGRFGRMFRSVHGVRPSEYLRQQAVS